MIGIWGAGATYVPLDPDYPEARLADMTDRAVYPWSRSARLAGFAAHLASTRPSSSRRLRPPGTAPGLPLRRAEPAADDIAYVLFTSGSSGRPKAVRGLPTGA